MKCSNTPILGTGFNSCNYNTKNKFNYFLLKIPPPSRSNPNAVQGENMRIFFMQEIKNHHLKAAMQTGHIILIG